MGMYERLVGQYKPKHSYCSGAGPQSPTRDYLQWGAGGSIVTKYEGETEDIVGTTYRIQYIGKVNR
jgi:hypothetical protein